MFYPTKYFTLPFNDFFKEIEKEIKIPQRNKQELLENEFNESVSLVKSLQNEIQDLEIEINKLVYSLYGLTAEDITIIENSFKE